MQRHATTIQMPLKMMVPVSNWTSVAFVVVTGIPRMHCDCDGNVEDALGDCGGDCAADDDADGICDDEDDCVWYVRRLRHLQRPRRDFRLRMC